MSWRYLTARLATAYGLAWLLVFVVLLALAPKIVVLPVEFVWGQPTRWTPIWEALPALLGASTGAFIAPRMATWERLRNTRLRACAALTSATALALPALLPWLTHFGLPDDARWLDITFNVLAVTAVSLLLTAAVGSLYGTVLSCATYVGLVLVQHIAPEIAIRIPFSGIPGRLRPHIWETLVLGAVAVAVWTWALGKSRFAAALSRND